MRRVYTGAKRSWSLDGKIGIRVMIDVVKIRSRKLIVGYCSFENIDSQISLGYLMEDLIDHT